MKKKGLLRTMVFVSFMAAALLTFPWPAVRAYCTGNEIIWSVAVNPTDSSIVYMGTGRGIVYVSLDGGESCYHIDLQIPPPIRRVYAIAIDPNDPSIVYAGTSFGAPGTGLYRSYDFGAHWTAVSPTQRSGIGCLLIDPTSPGTVYAGSTAESISITPEGMFKTVDGGDNWFPINDGLFPVRFNSLAIDPVDPNTIYAASWRGLAESGGVSKTTNGGDSWFRPGLTSGYAPAIVVHPTNRFTVYYIDAGYLGNYLQKSVNGGVTWFDASSGLPRYESPVSLAIDPNDGETLFLGTNKGIYKTVNGGRSWFSAGTALNGESVLSIAIAPSDSNTVYVGTEEDGCFKSTDGGATWFDC